MQPTAPLNAQPVLQVGTRTQADRSHAMNALKITSAPLHQYTPEYARATPSHFHFPPVYWIASVRQALQEHRARSVQLVPTNQRRVKATAQTVLPIFFVCIPLQCSAQPTPCQTLAPWSHQIAYVVLGSQVLTVKGVWKDGTRMSRGLQSV